MKNMESSSSRDADECLKSWKLDSIKIECSDSSNAEDCIERTSEDASCVEQLTSCFGSTKVEPVDSCDFNSPDSFPSEETVYLGSNRISTVEHLIDEKGKIINRKDMNISGGEPVVSNYDVKLEGDLIKEEISFDETYIEDSKIFTKEFWKTEDGTFSNHCGCSIEKELRENSSSDCKTVSEVNIHKTHQKECHLLQVHIDSVHINVKNHKSAMCDSSNSFKSALKIHHLKVKNSKNLRCQMCEFTTSKTSKLKEHVNSVHLNVKNHKCQMCEHTTSRKDNLNTHVNRVHLKVKNHMCPYCDYSASSTGPLKVHINAVHLKVKNYKCHICDYATSHKSSLTGHINVVHFKLKNYKCDMCEFISVRQDHLQHHKDRVHFKSRKHE